MSFEFEVWFLCEYSTVGSMKSICFVASVQKNINLVHIDAHRGGGGRGERGRVNIGPPSKFQNTC
jgi:hypothetical protein